MLSDFSHIIKITGSLCDRYRLDLKYIVLKMVVIFVNRYEKLKQLIEVVWELCSCIDWYESKNLDLNFKPNHPRSIDSKNSIHRTRKSGKRSSRSRLMPWTHYHS